MEGFITGFSSKLLNPLNLVKKITLSWLTKILSNLRLAYYPAVYFFSQMSRFHSYINTSEKIIESYKGDVPFSIFIKSFFAANKKFGSKDRKQISEFCFIYFRLSAVLDKYQVTEKIISSSFLYN